MSKSKYNKGKQIKSISDFENYSGSCFKVYFGMNTLKTIHRSFLISWQYRILKRFIENGHIYEAIKKEEQDDL